MTMMIVSIQVAIRCKFVFFHSKYRVRAVSHKRAKYNAVGQLGHKGVSCPARAVSDYCCVENALLCRECPRDDIYPRKGLGPDDRQGAPVGVQL